MSFPLSLSLYSFLLSPVHTQTRTNMLRRILLGYSFHHHHSALSARSIASVAWNDRAISLEGKGSRIHHLPHTWLRDHCPCPKCIHPGTRQKLHGSGDVPEHVKPSTVSLSDQGLEVKWAPDSWTADGHLSVYPPAWLQQHLEPSSGLKMKGAFCPIPWKATDLDLSSLHIPYHDFMHSDASLRAALTLLTQRGVCFLHGVPQDELAIQGIAERIGPIRNTFYGKTWDVRADPEAKNIAYTSLDLGLHMDLM